MIEIGTNVQKVIKSKLENIDRINKLIINKKTNKKFKNKDKNQIIKKINVKMQNMINDFHWKAANFLVKNYNEILIGNFSTKSMNENNINKKLKRIATELRFFQFKQKLQYLCAYRGINYKCVDEYGTTKMCSNCTYYKKNIGANKIFDCDNCKKIIDRDYNSAKNILMKGSK